jgi:hypothetical protein
LEFSLNLVEPTGHLLAVQWLTNGSPVPEATNSSLILLPSALGNGVHTISAQVADSTPLVRTDPGNSLRQTRTWTLTVNLPWLQLTAPRSLAAGGFTFHVAGLAPQGFAIWASTNLVDWQSVATNALVNGHSDYTNTSATNLARQYFRAVTPP